MRSGECAQHVLAGAGAGIDQPGGAQFLKDLRVIRNPGALVIRRMWSADIRTFAPLQLEPPHVLQHRGHELGPATRAVEIVIAQKERAASLSAALLREPESPGVAEMQQAG